MSPPSPARLLAAATLLALLAACAAHPWWVRDLAAWEGAPAGELLDAWGTPLRTLPGDDGRTVLVYERTRRLDHRIERLAEPGARLDPTRSPAGYTPPGQSDCMLFFELAADRVVATRHEGAACDVVPREPERRRADPGRRAR